jgi:hypothetical protein
MGPVKRRRMLTELRAERSAKCAKVRREVFAMHAEGGPCWVGKCCQEMKTRIGAMKPLGNDLF